MEIFGWKTPFFQLSGPFEEFSSVLVLFLIISVLRIAVGVVSVIAVECALPRAAPPELRKKIRSNGWYAFYYTLVLLWGLGILYKTGWLLEPLKICSHENAERIFRRFPMMHLYYSFQVAFYLNYIYAMVTKIDEPRKDWLAFLAHHVITILLILYSRNTGYLRIQIAIFVIHDAADPFLHLAKLIHLMRWTRLADIVMGVFAVVFFVTRWIIYPMQLVEACRVKWYQYYPRDFHIIRGGADMVYLQFSERSVTVFNVFMSYHGLSTLLLYALFALHLFWGAYILRMAYKKLVERTPSSGSEGDGDEFDTGPVEGGVDKTKLKSN